MKTCSRCGRVVGDYEFSCPTCGYNFIEGGYDLSSAVSPFEVPDRPYRSDFDDGYYQQPSIDTAYIPYDREYPPRPVYAGEPSEYISEDRSASRQGNSVIILLGVAASILIVIIALIAILMISPSSKPKSSYGGSGGYYGGGTTTTKITEKETVPDVVGFKLDVAKQKLSNAGFRYSVEYKTVDDVVTDVVLSQSPEALKIVDKNTTVNLVVAKLRVKTQSEIDEETKVWVPNVVGMSLEDAEKKIKDSSLEPRIKEYQYSSSVKENHIISQDPKGDGSEQSHVKKHSEVYLVVSKGEDMSNYVQIGDYTGQDINKVKKDLEGVGLKVDYSYSDHDTYKKDQIISQNTASGTYVEKGSTIKFDVSTGNKPGTKKNSAKPIFHGVSASSILAPESGYTYDPSNALHDDDTCWTEGVDGDGVGEYIMLYDSEVQTVSGCQIKNGYTKSEEAFNNNGRLSKVTFEFSDGSTYTTDIDPNRMDLQTIEFPEPVETTSLKIIIAEAKTGDKYEDTCITLIMPY